MSDFEEQIAGAMAYADKQSTEERYRITRAERYDAPDGFQVEVLHDIASAFDGGMPYLVKVSPPKTDQFSYEMAMSEEGLAALYVAIGKALS